MQTVGLFLPTSAGCLDAQSKLRKVAVKEVEAENQEIRWVGLGAVFHRNNQFNQNNLKLF
jgi:hypothetical protein